MRRSHTVAILKELKENGHYKLYALTNWSAETFPKALELYDFLHWFDGRIVSGEEKMRKPEHEFYRLLTDRYGVKPSESIFIDDNLRNIEAAQKMGYHCIHFLSPEQFEIELEKLLS